MAVTGALGAFIGSFLTGYVPVALLLTVIGMIVLYESYMLLKGPRIKNENQNINRNEIDDNLESEDYVETEYSFIHKRVIIIESIIGFGIGILGGSGRPCSREYAFAYDDIKTENGIQSCRRDKSGGIISYRSIWITRTRHE